MTKLKLAKRTGNYNPLPSDITSYVKDSVMAKTPEIDLWDFMEKRPDKEYEKWATDFSDMTLKKKYDAKPMFELNLEQDKFFTFMKNNKDTCQKKFYEKRPYHSGVNDLTLGLPMKAGYNNRNTVEYNWGLYGDSNERLKDMLGDRKVWDDKIGIDRDTALLRLLCYMPGNTLPWHIDTLGNWCRENKDLNPSLDTLSCDLGPIKRYLVMITDWHWGHVIQMENSYWPNYKSGDVFDLPLGVPHCSTNMGVRLKLTCSISGAKIK